MSSASTSTKAPANAGQCSLYKFPPEIRKMIFICASHNFINDPKWEFRGDMLFLCRDPNLSDRCFPNYVDSWKRVLDPSGPGSKTYNGQGLTPFEFVLFQSEKNLYLECFHTRLSLSYLLLPRVFPTYTKTRSTQRFELDAIKPLLEHVRHVKYVGPSRDDGRRHDFRWHECRSHVTGERCNYAYRQFAEAAKFLAPAIHQNQKKFLLEVGYLGYNADKRPCHSLYIGDADEICKETLGLEVVREVSGRLMWCGRQYVTSNSPKSVPMRDLV